MSILGHVQADNIEDPDNLDSIRLGWMSGDGLLGDALVAGLKMASAAEDYGYSGSLDEVAAKKWEQARVKFYQALKAIEVAT